GDLDDPQWMQPAVYALQYALTALWSTLGIRPGAVFGASLGELAAAQAAGVFGLEDGLRLAAARGAAGAAMPGERTIEAAFGDVDFSSPKRTLVSGMTGRVFGPGEVPDEPYWQRQGREPFAIEACAETLASLQVDAVLEIGPDAALGPAMHEAWPAGAEGGPPAVLASIGQPASDTAESWDGDAFAAAVAGAYEAGLSFDWEGLFAGERRRRISLPGYPFQRRRYWIKAAKQ
ncbi:MAG: acyltransferase domain-containing protein, partial [Rhodospirillaceae bacterium]|nr:acyltransferase domain-containing protein [Rhodospirillaceae bacterium]